MKTTRLLACCLLAGLLVPALAGESEDDRTLSPYFQVQSDDPSVDKLPLLSTTAKADIAGVIADVVVTQVYKNEGKKPIEAIYIFPASTRAAVYGMKMTIGDRTIVADIKEREQARQDYEHALENGQSASLLEQQRPNVFQMNVGNIMPGDTIVVELRYTELLVPTDGVYEFVYPTVVGPRYSNTPKDGAADTEKWVANPYTHQGEAPLYEFDINVDLQAGLPIQEMTCPSHKTSISYDGLTSGFCRLDASERGGGNRDFVLRYRLAGGQVQSGMLLYRGEKENFFLTMIQPPKRVTLDQIPGREYIFIVDVSGSMYGFPLDVSKKLLRDLITNLRKTDRFNVMLFAGGSSVMSEQSLAATEANIAKAVQLIDDQEGGGATELLPALKRALALPRVEGMSRSMVIATDGYVTVEAEAFDLIRKSLGDANLFAFGIGSGVNRHLIEGMARVGMGEPFVVTDEAEAGPRAKKFREYIQSPVLTQVRAEFKGFEVYDVEPLSIPDVLADRPVIVFGKWRGQPKGTVTLRGRTGKGKYEQSLNVAEFAPSPKNAGLRYLWARHRIQLLDDYNNLAPDDKRVKEVTQLGLDYNLLTQYTSFVAIDSRVRADGTPTTVKQPLPLPEGVSDYAVGGWSGAGLGGAKRGMAKTRAPMAAAQTVCEATCDELEDGDGFLAEPTDRSGELLPVAVTDVTVTIAGSPAPDVLVQAVRALVEQNLGAVQNDYAVELVSDPNLGGEVLAKLTIEPDGTVGKVEFLKNELNKAIRQSVERALKALVFGNTAGARMTAFVTLEFTS
jgi:Ca-activated chloride channel family protein